MKEALLYSNIHAKFVCLPWERVYYTAEYGKVNGIVTWGFRNSRLKHFIYSDPVFNGEWVFFHMKEFKFKWSSMNDLKGLQIGILPGNTYSKEFWKAGEIRKGESPAGNA